MKQAEVNWKKFWMAGTFFFAVNSLMLGYNISNNDFLLAAVFMIGVIASIITIFGSVKIKYNYK